MGGAQPNSPSAQARPSGEVESDTHLSAGQKILKAETLLVIIRLQTFSTPDRGSNLNRSLRPNISNIIMLYLIYLVQGGRGWLAFGDRSRIPQSFRRARICKFLRQKHRFLQLRENRPFVVVKRLTHTHTGTFPQTPYLMFRYLLW